MKICICNLQKRAGLASELIDRYNPDMMLCQEINLCSERDNFNGPNSANSTSRMGYGTAIYSSANSPLVDVKAILSPYAEFGGIIHKKTTLATMEGVQYVSFHGYNGQPFKSVQKLVAHIDAVLSAMTLTSPAVFAGDFNTWSEEHLNAVKMRLQDAGFSLAYSWPYPGREFPLDHAFVRRFRLQGSSYFTCASDHQGAILELDVID